VHQLFHCSYVKGTIAHCTSIKGKERVKRDHIRPTGYKMESFHLNIPDNAKSDPFLSDNMELDYSPIPENILSSYSSPGSASDYMGRTPKSNPLAHQQPLAWQSVTFMDAQKVPRVVSTLMPSDILQLQEGRSSNNSSPANSESSSSTSNNSKRSSPHSPGNPIFKDSARHNQAKGDPTIHRRQKRLERNRESARLSRRRRKHYLEVLEERVTEHSFQLDLNRRAHVKKAVPTIHMLRQGQIASGLVPSARNLSRSSQELSIANVFWTQQLKSFVVAPSLKFVMWLTLQTDAFFRGGRAQSERLSAARIGERVSVLLRKVQPVITAINPNPQQYSLHLTLAFYRC
jgi:hypothetical protein